MTGERPAVPCRAPAPCPPAAGKASCPHACGTPIGAPRLPGECSAVTRPPVGRLAGPPPATGQHLPCWHPNPSPGAPWPPRTGRCAELNPRPSHCVPSAHRVGRAPSQNGAPANPDPADPAPGVWSPRRGNQRSPRKRLALLLVLPPVLPTPGMSRGRPPTRQVSKREG